MSGSILRQYLSSGVDENEKKATLRKWLNLNFRIEMTDGRVLIGVFLCTDRDANIILAILTSGWMVASVFSMKDTEYLRVCSINNCLLIANFTNLYEEVPNNLERQQLFYYSILYKSCRRSLPLIIMMFGACSEYLLSEDGQTEEPRVLGLVMVPGRHILSIELDETQPQIYGYEE